MEALDIFYEKVMEFVLIFKSDNCFDEELYNEIYEILKDMAADWKTKESIPKSVFIACISLIDCLAGGNHFFSEKDIEKAEDASAEVTYLIESLIE